jgi:leader peptidase (prepilin peptidase)/N-methyltransferase
MNISPDTVTLLTLGPIIGSFVGVVIRRLPTKRPILVGRSACEQCGHTLGPRDLVPLLSYAASAGRCRHCRAPIGLFHPLVEIAGLAIAATVCAITPDPGQRWLGCGLGWTLLALGWIDFDHRRLPDVLTLPLLLAGLAVTQGLMPNALIDHAGAAVLGYLGFRGIALAYRRWRHRDGLGQGDAKLLAAGGAWLGLAALPNVLLIGAGLTLIAALLSTLRGTRISRTSAFAFGPGLAFAIWAVWLATA